MGQKYGTQLQYVQVLFFVANTYITDFSLGGGGIRALCQLYLLKYLFERVAFHEKHSDPNNKVTSSASSPMFRYYSDNPSKSRAQTVEGVYLPCHYFDYVGGTSVGG